MDTIIQEIENLLQTNYQNALDQIQKDNKKRRIIQHITWLLIVLAYAAIGCGAFLQKISTRNAVFSIALITVAAICTAGMYISKDYGNWILWFLLVIVYIYWCSIIITVEIDTDVMFVMSAMCVCMICCMLGMTVLASDWMSGRQRKMPSREDVMEYVRRVRDGDIPMIHAEPIVKKSQITRSLTTSQEKGMYGIMTITPEKSVPFLTSIYIGGNDDEHQSKSASISVPINAQQDIIQWANLPIPDNAELSYTKITLFPEISYVDEVYIIRNQHSCEFVKAFDAIGRIIVLECIRDSLECRPEYLFRFDKNNKVKADIGWHIYHYLRKDESAADGHTAEIIRQYTERLNGLLEDGQNITIDQYISGKPVAAIAQTK